MPTPSEMYDAAIQLKNSGDLPGAVAKLEELAAMAPEHSDTRAALAVYLQRLGKFEEAIEHAKKVCELLPNDPFSYTQLSVIYVKCGKIPEAEEAKARAHMAQGR
ncbi:tetratricopeptide repeat protein [Planctomicrobium piriforme]|uniref:Tetratricopeptide repeat-containing protein n=1 Tax=Planctomicrobium piriforme TaxID=1576369 RepID=A0A1I3HK26_9PLAN|nr:tetratricopeptide repeat protein [Planctomicrobium piriforme]SFI36021.1 Tetratricopeptide repeat-containing protein [Planctomicrobium piriforme]